MNQLYPQTWQPYLGVLMVFLRLMGLFLHLPGFSHKAIPGVVKVLMGLTIALVIQSIVRPHLGSLPESIGGLGLVALRETMIGLMMGFAAFITMEAIHLAAQFIGYQMGLGTAGLIDPQNQSSVSVMVPWHGWVALILFFVADMHHDILSLFVKSFEMTGSVGAHSFQGTAFVGTLIAISGKLFYIAVQMAAPMTLLLLGTNAAIGILARTMPQMNILLFAFPMTLLLGLGGMFVIAPEFVEYLNSILAEMAADVLLTLRSL